MDSDESLFFSEDEAEVDFFSELDEFSRDELSELRELEPELEPDLDRELEPLPSPLLLLLPLLDERPERSAVGVAAGVWVAATGAGVTAPGT